MKKESVVGVDVFDASLLMANVVDVVCLFVVVCCLLFVVCCLLFVLFVAVCLFFSHHHLQQTKQIQRARLLLSLDTVDDEAVINVVDDVVGDDVDDVAVDVVGNDDDIDDVAVDVVGGVDDVVGDVVVSNSSHFLYLFRI